MEPVVQAAPWWFGAVLTVVSALVVGIIGILVREFFKFSTARDERSEKSTQAFMDYLKTQAVNAGTERDRWHDVAAAERDGWRRSMVEMRESFAAERLSWVAALTDLTSGLREHTDASKANYKQGEVILRKMSELIEVAADRPLGKGERP